MQKELWGRGARNLFVVLCAVAAMVVGLKVTDIAFAQRTTERKPAMVVDGGPEVMPPSSGAVESKGGTETKQEMIVDLQAIEKKQAEDPMLQANDIVDVPTSATKSFLRSLMNGVVPSVSQLPVRVVP